MPAAATRFMFDTDFAAGASPAERPVPASEHALKLGEAESRGFAAGFAQADKEGQAAAARRQAAAFEQIGDAVAGIARKIDDVERRLEAEAIEVAVTVARKLAPALVEREPFAEIEALAADCFRQLRSTPHVAIRVNDRLLAVARESLEAIAREQGFEGRIVVMAEPDIGYGDCRIEWADGGVRRDRAATEAAIAQAVTRYVTGCSVAQSSLPEVQP